METRASRLYCAAARRFYGDAGIDKQDRDRIEQAQAPRSTKN
jgi:hypothetical protein